MSNLYYSPEQFGLEMMSFEDDTLSYEFDILAFWVNCDGVVYSASDSGCSCPVPFEDYHSLCELERVCSVDHAKAIFKSWGKGSPDDKRKLIKWIEHYLDPIVELCLTERLIK